MIAYHSFINPDTQEPYGSFCVEFIAYDPLLSSGWYWFACFPGCVPDGEPMGPFETYEQAVADAREE